MSNVNDALDRLARHFERVAVESPHVAAAFKEDLATVRAELERLREERDAKDCEAGR